MKILYDYQIFEHQVHGGISRYFYQLMEAMRVSAGMTYELPLQYSSNQYVLSIPELSGQLKGPSDFYRQFLNGTEFKGKWTLFQLHSRLFPRQLKVNQQLSIEALGKQQFDIFHPTDLHDYFLPSIGNKPFVITIHDMIDEIYPEYGFHVHSTYRSSLKETLIKKASAIIAVSENTKRDILARFSVPEKKIKVIYHGASELTEATSNSPLVTSPYFLFVGKRVHYKNFYFLLQCAQPLLLANRDLKIICVGPGFNAKETAYFRDLGVIDQILHFNASDAMLANLYQHATAFVYPSLYEGFGMPVLEAFQKNCPVITSQTSSLPEVAGDAALYIDPKSIVSLRHALQTMLTDVGIRQTLIQKGNEQLKRFSWLTTAHQTFELYKSLA